MDSDVKTITVKYFALFRELAGIESETLQFSGKTAADVFAATEHRHNSTQPLGHCKVAINDVMSEWHNEVADGDVVLLFPPVAGG